MRACVRAVPRRAVTPSLPPRARAQLLAARNFAVYSCVSFLQVFDCTLEKNFFPIFLELLVGSHASLELRGAIVAASFLAPHLCTIAATPIVERLGVCAVFHGIFKLRLALLAMAVLAGGYSWQSVCLVRGRARLR